MDRSSFISPDTAVAPESGSGLVGEGKSAHTGGDEWVKERPRDLHDKDLTEYQWRLYS